MSNPIMRTAHPHKYWATPLSEEIHAFLCKNDAKYGWMDTKEIAHYLHRSYSATNGALNNLWRAGLISARRTSWSRGWYRGIEYSVR
jgi:predicted transcriptional regulator